MKFKIKINSMPKSFFITASDENIVMDILSDKFTEKGLDIFFDDKGEFPDEQVLICGNSPRRLIIGGGLDIQKILSI